MNAGERRPWTREELILAVNLYCRIPFGKIHERNSQIIELAKLIGRTPGSVSWKLVNFAHIDPSLDRKGASNTSKLDKEIWAEFFNNWDTLAFESERIFAELRQTTLEKSSEIQTQDLPNRETERIGLVRIRVTQQFFRRMVLSSYDYKCCITGISIPELLIASHIVPWSQDNTNRTNPRNGLCLNALHDKAFDNGLITITNGYRVLVSDSLKEAYARQPEIELLIRFNNKLITCPKRFLPDPQFLDYHQKHIFRC